MKSTWLSVVSISIYYSHIWYINLTHFNFAEAERSGKHVCKKWAIAAAVRNWNSRISSSCAVEASLNLFFFKFPKSSTLCARFRVFSFTIPFWHYHTTPLGWALFFSCAKNSDCFNVSVEMKADLLTTRERSELWWFLLFVFSCAIQQTLFMFSFSLALLSVHFATSELSSCLSLCELRSVARLS